MMKHKFEIVTHGYVNDRYDRLKNVVVRCSLIDDQGEVIDTRDELVKDLDDSLHNTSFEDLEGFELSRYKDELTKIVDKGVKLEET